MPYLSSNISSLIFYRSIFSDFLRIARCTLRLTDFVRKVSQLYPSMITQGGIKASIQRQIEKPRYVCVFVFVRMCMGLAVVVRI